MISVNMLKWNTSRFTCNESATALAKPVTLSCTGSESISECAKISRNSHSSVGEKVERMVSYDQ